jgi:hypothetical protein
LPTGWWAWCCRKWTLQFLKEISSVRRVHDNGEWSKMPIQKRDKMLIEHTDIYIIN